jgi:hypothetical protein
VFLVKHPMVAATRAHAAIHEAAHFISFELGGLGAGAARIDGSAFGHGGWSGEAWPWNSHIKSSLLDLGPDDFLREAQYSAAGPLAEELLGDGCAVSSIGELVEARVFADRAAELLNCDEIETWHAALRGGIALVERYWLEILDIARLLERRRRIFRLEGPTQKVLGRITQAPIDLTSVSERGLGLFQKIQDALKDLAQ